MPKLPTSPSAPSYGDTYVRRAMRVVAEEYARRLQANAAARKASAGDGIARHLNPESLEAARSLSRSADSVLGNMLETLARNMARGKWGPEAAPDLIAGHGVTAADLAKIGRHAGKQIVVSRVDYTALRDKVAACYSAPNVDMARLTALAQKPPMGTAIIKRPLDLIVVLRNQVVAAELKMSGDLDAKNGPKNVEELLAIACMIGPKALPRFVLANKRTADSQATRYVSDPILVGRDEFWAWLLPPGRDWAWFDRAFGDAAAPVRDDLSRWLSAA